MKELLERNIKISEMLSRGEAALVSSDVSVTYLTGFQHSEGYVLVCKDKSYFLVDFRYAEAAEKSDCGIEVAVFSNVFETISELLEKHSIKTVYLESGDVTISKYNVLREKLKQELDTSDKLSDFISRLRIVKSESEINKLRKAQQIAEKAYLEVLKTVKVGMSEKEISAKLEYLMKLSGAEKVSFDLITVAGKKTSLPHGVPDDYKIQNGDFITFDIGAVYGGYCSDMTRTVAIGEVTEEQKKIYDIVLRAHYEGLKAVKSGVKGYDVDKAARDLITSEGYGEYFGHSTGHGVGLEIHESPYASKHSNDILESGMTVTVEPGIYLPDKFGVRIEDTVLVTDDGYESFASIPKELIII